MTDSTPSERWRILQIYDPEQQKQFSHFSPQDRLEWLASINQLYWQGRMNAEK
jgi:hypothetical protein